jgi:multidrug efflux pump subunit AcrA (membrane-fusion protein)
VVQSDNVFDPREVELGAKADSFYQVKSGLLEGERVVTSGNFLIDSESRLKSALEGAGSGGGHVHGG